MQARFKLFLLINRNSTELAEAELDQGLDLVFEHLRNDDVLTGAIILSGPDMPEFVMPDEMLALITGFCFESIVALLERQQETYVYNFFNCGSICVLVASRGIVTILSDDDQEGMPTIRCQQGELLPALYRCGVRYMEFLKRLERAGRQDAASPQHLVASAERARNALIAHSLIQE